MTSVFSCTSDALVDTSVARPYPPLCNLTAAPGGAACMDVVDTVQCWTPAHMAYTLPPLLLLPVYCWVRRRAGGRRGGILEIHPDKFCLGYGPRVPPPPPPLTMTFSAVGILRLRAAHEGGGAGDTMILCTRAHARCFLLGGVRRRLARPQCARRPSNPPSSRTECNEAGT